MSSGLLTLMMDKLTSIETRLDGMATKDDIANMATKDDIVSVKEELSKLNSKLDIANEQIVRNSEVLSIVPELAATVSRHSTDINLLKKAVSNS